jgi:uncharacterized membrane protein SpoIIM required for sporulation
MAWNLLITSDSGLFSLFAIIFTVGIAVWFARYFIRKMDEDGKKAAEASAARAEISATSAARRRNK